MLQLMTSQCENDVITMWKLCHHNVKIMSSQCENYVITMWQLCHHNVKIISSHSNSCCICHGNGGGPGNLYKSSYNMYWVMTNVGLLKPWGYLMTLSLRWAGSTYHMVQCGSCLVLYFDWSYTFTTWYNQ